MRAPRQTAPSTLAHIDVPSPTGRQDDRSRRRPYTGTVHVFVLYETSACTTKPRGPQRPREKYGRKRTLIKTHLLRRDRSPGPPVRCVNSALFTTPTFSGADRGAPVFRARYTSCSTRGCVGMLSDRVVFPQSVFTPERSPMIVRHQARKRATIKATQPAAKSLKATARAAEDITSVLGTDELDLV